MQKIQNINSYSVLSVGEVIQFNSRTIHLNVIAPADTEFYIQSPGHDPMLIAMVTGSDELRLSMEGETYVTASNDITYRTKDGKIVSKENVDPTFLVAHVPNKVSPELQKLMERDAIRDLQFKQQMQSMQAQIQKSKADDINPKPPQKHEADIESATPSTIEAGASDSSDLSEKSSDGATDDKQSQTSQDSTTEH